MTEFQKEVIRALADNNMNVNRTGKQLYTHRNNIYYHTKKICAETGKNPLCFRDLCELLQAVSQK